MINGKSSRNRKRMMIASISGIILLVTVLIQLGVATGSTGSATGLQENQGSFSGAIFEVVPEIGLDALRMLPQGPFAIKGNIFRLGTLNPDGTVPSGASAGLVGTWRAWGHVVDGGRIVENQSYELDSFLGTIQLQGVEGDNPLNGRRLHHLAIVGGTGTYTRATGEAKIRILNQTTGAFRFTMITK